MRIPYCTGCDHTFERMHELINHRRTNRCGGRFLPQEGRDRIDALRLEREEAFRVYRAEAIEAGTRKHAINWPF